MILHLFMMFSRLNLIHDASVPDRHFHPVHILLRQFCDPDYCWF